MSRRIVGARIRERRRGLGITQVALARRIGISSSYLNLIEHNKRSIAGTLLRRAAEALDLRLEDLDGATERRLLASLEEISRAPEIASLGVETDSAGELIGRFPGWARAIAALSNAEREATSTARALADRLTHDPFLAEAVHGMLSRVTAVRSAIEILEDYPEIDAVSRQRFQQIIGQETRGLTEVGEALVTYFDKADLAERVLTPLDEVDALLDVRRNRFPEIESVAASLAERITATRRAARLEQARAVAEAELKGVVDAVIAAHPQVETELARDRARVTLLADAAGALLAPMDAFASEAASRGYDVEALAEFFAADVPTVCRRLTALPEAEGVPRFGYLQANAAGTIIERRALPGLNLPRHAAACPLWVLFRAQQSPESVMRQRTLFPTGARFVFLARARNTGSAGFGQLRHYLTDMLVLNEQDAMHTVYAPDPGVPVEPVGPACRSCPRPDCMHRVVDPLAG